MKTLFAVLLSAAVPTAFAQGKMDDMKKDKMDKMEKKDKMAKKDGMKKKSGKMMKKDDMMMKK